MLLIESRIGKRIDTIMIDALMNSEGNSRIAAREMGISASAFSKWVLDLQIVKDVDRIRESFGLSQTTTAVKMEVSRDDTTITIGESITGVCEIHGDSFDSLVIPTLVGVSTGFKVRTLEKEQFVVILDGDEKHRYPVASGGDSDESDVS
jgi:transposase-like protein